VAGRLPAASAATRLLKAFDAEPGA
jgi:hypothetical protein